MVAYKVFGAFLALRILSVFVVTTWYVPDEYWQSLEVGHKLAFGYGHLTWEWTRGIRSYIHPLLISLIYRLLAWLNYDQVEFLILVPRLLQAVISAIADYRFFKWNNNSKWSIFVISTSWFWFYTASRTLSNTLETSLTTIALSYYPRKASTDAHGFLWLVGIVCFLRPTAAIPWLPLCLYHIKKSIYSVFEIVLKRYLLIGLLVGAAAVTIDTYVHGSFILTPVEFLKVNIIEDIGTFYGSHPWHWYFTTGLPTILGITTIPFLCAVAQTLRSPKQYPVRYVLLWSTLFTLVVYSLLPHKEFRFILPLLPICLFITSDAITQWSRSASKLSLWLVAILLLAGNVLPAYYLSTVHQKGTLDIMPVLEKISREYKEEDGRSAKFVFLMPCHSTPYYSHIHQNVTMRFLTCEPNFNKQANYLDEADAFYANPASWVRSHFPVYPKSAMPSHIILFDNLQSKLTDFLVNYKEIHSTFHIDVSTKSFVPWAPIDLQFTTDRVGANVLIFERKGEKATKETEQQKPTSGNAFNPSKVQQKIEL